MNSGLYALAGASATATAAAWAKRLLEPMTKVSKVYLGFSRAGSPWVRLPRLSHRLCTPPVPGACAGRSKVSGSEREGGEGRGVYPPRPYPPPPCSAGGGAG